MRIRFEPDVLRSLTARVTPVVIAVLAAVVPARAQTVDIQSFEVTPFIGVRLGGTFQIQSDLADQADATLKDSTAYGLSAGLRFDDYSLVEIRWTQATSTLRLGAPFVVPSTPRANVALNQFHADFTREWVTDVKGLRTFLTVGLGLTHLGAAGDSVTRFSFGFGAGLKQFVGTRFAIRAEAHWLPIVVEPSVSGFACGTVQFGGCLVLLEGDLVQQFQFSVGPVIRF